MRSLYFGLLVVTTLVGPAIAARAQQSVVTSEVIDRARGDVAAIAASFGWTDPVPVIEGLENDTSPERVSLNTERLGELLRRVEIEDSEFAASLLVAHEVWHFVELRRSSATPARSDAEARRVYECRADLMAGYYATSIQSAATDTPLAPASLETSDAERIAARLWLKGIAAAETDYPWPQQRALASHYGALRAWRDRDRLSLEQGETADRMMHFRDGEPFDAWSERSCWEITHFGGEAMRSLGVMDVVFGPASGGMAFTVPYVNASRRPLEVSAVVVGQGAERRGDRRIASDRRWYFPQHFTIPPSGRHEVTGIVPGVATQDEFWLNFAPNDLSTPIMARFAGASLAEQIPRLGNDLDPYQMEFALALQRLANDAPNLFRNYRDGGATRSDNGLFYDSGVDVPTLGVEVRRVRGTSIQVTNEGAAFVTKTLLSRGTAEEADSLWEAVRRAVVDAWPDMIIREREMGDRREFYFFVTRYALVTIGRPTGENTVFFSMAPNLSGLTDFLGTPSANILVNP